MKTQRVLRDMQRVKALADVLSKSSEVTRYDSGTDREAWVLAHALSDIEESATRIYQEQVPKLMRAAGSSGEINRTLLEIGEELRHILYHIRDSRFYRYLYPQSSEEEQDGGRHNGRAEGG